MIKEYNSLKGILALMIFAHHCPIEFGCKMGLGVIAVTLFFMLSGFLSTVGYRDKVLSPNFSYKNYLIGKGIKFYPMHWLCLLMIAPLIFYGSSHWYYQLPVIAVNATLLQSLVPIPLVFFSFNAVAWFLSDTLIFVALFPLIMRWMLTTGERAKIYVGIVVLTIYAIAWVLIPEEYTHRFFYINPIFRIVDFIVGIQCGMWFMQLREKQALMATVKKNSTTLHFVGFLLLVALVWQSTIDEEFCFHSIIYLPFASILLILIGLNGGGYLSSILLQEFGKISFAFFLSHQIVLRYLSAVFGKIGLDNNYVTTIIAFLLSIICSYILTYYFDKNISLWLKKKINRQSMTAQS